MVWTPGAGGSQASKDYYAAAVRKSAAASNKASNRADTSSKKSWAEKRADRKDRNIYNESLRRAQEAQQQGRTPGKYLKGQILEHGWTDPSKERFRGSGKGNLGQTFKPVTAMFADILGQGLGSFMESEKARVGGKFNAPLNVQYGTPAYKWLLEDVIKDEKDQDDFAREVAKGNLSWTELNKYADDEYIGGGQLARGINEMNALDAGIASGEGAAILDDYVNAGLNEDGKGMIGDAAARIARAQKEGRAGFATPEARMSASPEEIIQSNIYSPSQDVDYGEAGPDEVEDWMGPEGPAEMIAWQQKLNEETAANDEAQIMQWGGYEWDPISQEWVRDPFANSLFNE